MTVRYYSSVAPETTLSNTINNAAVSITVGSTVGFPALTPYTLALDYEGATEELVQVNAAAGNTLTVTRAIDGTSAAAHNAGARVRHVTSARDFADSRSHENSDEGVHGLDPSEEIVGTEKVQTLTNKTLESPAFTGAFTGTLTGGPATTDKIRLENDSNASPTSTDHAFQIGPDSGVNLRLGDNEVTAANNGSIAGLAVQPNGGSTSFGFSLSADNTSSLVVVNGLTTTNQLVVNRAAATSNAAQVKANADTQARLAVRADGQMAWSSGSVAADVNLYRSSPGNLKTDGNLNSLAMVAADGIFDTLTVDNAAVLPKSTSTGASLATAQTGWSLSSAQAAATAGVITIQATVTRTGGTITVGADGNLADSPMVQLNQAFAAANPILGDLHFAASNAVGVGAAYMTGGLVSLQSWVPNQDIKTGDNISFYLTYVQ